MMPLEFLDTTLGEPLLKTGFSGNVVNNCLNFGELSDNSRSLLGRAKGLTLCGGQIGVCRRIKGIREDIPQQYIGHGQFLANAKAITDIIAHSAQVPLQAAAGALASIGHTLTIGGIIVEECLLLFLSPIGDNFGKSLSHLLDMSFKLKNLRNIDTQVGEDITLDPPTSDRDGPTRAASKVSVPIMPHSEAT